MKLGDIVKLQRGTTYKSRLLGLPGPVLLGLASIERNGGFRSDSLKTYGGESPEKLILMPDELYVSLKDVTQSADLLGAVAKVPKTISRGRLTQDTVKLIFHEKSIPKDYIYWLLRTPQYRAYCLSHAIGTTNLSLSRDDFLSFEVPPLTDVILTIIEMLECIESKIELNSRMNETLEETARVIFKSWFVDFDPVHGKARGEMPIGMDEETAAMFPDSFEESELGPIPKGWKAGFLGDVLDVLATGDRPKGGVSGYLEGIPSIGAESIVKLGIFDYSKTKYVPEKYYRDLRRGKLIDRDVLLYKDGGRPGIFIPHVSMFGDGFPYSDMCINSHVYRLRSDYLSQEFLYFWMSSEKIMSDMHLRGGGAAIPGINSSQVKTLTSLIPPSGVIEKFRMVVNPLVSRIFANSNQSRTLTETRDTLLPKLVSGEVRVGEIINGT